MPDFTLELGGVVFQDFEIPDKLRGGGSQQMKVRQYAGGIRKVDTLGPDDLPLEWKGHFEGPDAEARCQVLDTMRRQGLPISLTWSNYAYLVTIEKFVWDFRRLYHFSYDIALTVIQDLLNAPPVAQGDVESQMQSDAADASTDSANLPAVQHGASGSWEPQTGATGSW